MKETGWKIVGRFVYNLCFYFPVGASACTLGSWLTGSNHCTAKTHYCYSDVYICIYSCPKDFEQFSQVSSSLKGLSLWRLPPTILLNFTAPLPNYTTGGISSKLHFQFPFLGFFSKECTAMVYQLVWEPIELHWTLEGTSSLKRTSHIFRFYF